MSFQLHSSNMDYSLYQDTSFENLKKRNNVDHRSTISKLSPNGSFSSSKYHNHGLCLLSISPTRLPNNSNYYAYEW